MALALFNQRLEDLAKTETKDEARGWAIENRKLHKLRQLTDNEHKSLEAQGQTHIAQHFPDKLGEHFGKDGWTPVGANHDARNTRENGEPGLGLTAARRVGGTGAGNGPGGASTSMSGGADAPGGDVASSGSASQVPSAPPELEAPPGTSTPFDPGTEYWPCGYCGSGHTARKVKRGRQGVMVAECHEAGIRGYSPRAFRTDLHPQEGGV